MPEPKGKFPIQTPLHRREQLIHIYSTNSIIENRGILEQKTHFHWEPEQHSCVGEQLVQESKGIIGCCYNIYSICWLTICLFVSIIYLSIICHLSTRKGILNRILPISNIQLKEIVCSLIHLIAPPKKWSTYHKIFKHVKTVSSSLEICCLFLSQPCILLGLFNARHTSYTWTIDGYQFYPLARSHSLSREPLSWQLQHKSWRESSFVRWVKSAAFSHSLEFHLESLNQGLALLWYWGVDRKKTLLFNDTANNGWYH